MEKTETETHDFMNVDSFSQLPFIRPAPVKEKVAIRLFGKEFGGAHSDESDHSAETTTASAAARPLLDNNQDHSSRDSVDNNNNNNNRESSNRKFECHYCCRNFPTSQALGGHQNAHKRERQHAKRAHLQSAMVHSSFTEAQMYGIMNYHRLAAAGPPPPSLAAYHRSWNSTEHNNINNHSARLYGGGYGTPNYSSSSHHQTVPINGSPLGLWRIPAAQNSGGAFNRERLINPVPLLAGELDLKGASRTASNVSSQQNRYMFEPKSTNVQDHVSLDLHL